VVWSDGAPPDFISRDRIDRFEREGMLVLENLFSIEEIERAIADLDRMRGHAESLEPGTVVREPQADAIRSIFRVHRQSNAFANLARNARLRALVEYILGDRVYIMQSRINEKPAFDGACFDWHSDFETWHAEDGMPRMRAVSVSVFLSENSTLNGPTMFVPGSHKTFVACPGETPQEHYKTSLRRQEFGVPGHEAIAELAGRAGLVAPSGPAGTAVLFDCNLLHASAMNMTPWPRRNAFFVFNAVSNELEDPFDRGEPRPDFLAERHVSADRHQPAA